MYVSLLPPGEGAPKGRMRGVQAKAARRSKGEGKKFSPGGGRKEGGMAMATAQVDRHPTFFVPCGMLDDTVTLYLSVCYITSNRANRFL